MVISGFDALSTNTPSAPQVGPAGTPEPEVFVFPVSFAQQRLWFLEQLDPNSGQYNMATAVQLQGVVQIAALQQSLQYLTERHESLRTTFRTVGDDLMQVVHPQGQVSLRIVEGATLGAADRWQTWLVEEAQRPFNLAQGPLLRVTLLQRTPREQILLLVMHHIISDGWSLNILVRELATVYAALAAGETPALAELPIQYADFAIWQRDWLEQGERERQLQYWQNQLQGLAPLQLATDFPRPATASGNGARQTWILSPQLAHGLKQLSQQSRVTLYMTLLAAWQTLLYRYSGQDDFAVGSPVANRNQAETQGLIGCFVNTLVLRSDFRENLTFRQLLDQVRTTVLGAYEHQDLPFETLVETLQPERDLSCNPLFQVWFALNHAPTEPLTLSGLTWQPIPLARSTTQFDLSLEVVDHDQTLVATVEYRTDLFQAETITRLWHHFQVLIAAILADPDAEIATLSLLPPAEQQQVLVEWNQTQRDFPQVCIHELFEQQVARTPDAIAVRYQDQFLTYAELNQRANQLAQYLQQQGAGPETLVGLCLERSLEMVVGLLGILKAGGAYLPLDPGYPPERLAFMLADSQAPILLTQASLLPHLPQHQAQTICLDTDWPAIQDYSPIPNPKSQIPNPQSLAYVIYTSGSTGKPKGVMIEHRNLVNYTAAAIDAYGITEGDRILQFASISFDAAAEEIFPGLVQGATLVLRSEEMLHSLDGFLQACGDLGITVLDLPTAFWHQLTVELAAGRLVLPGCLRLVVIGGERALRERVAAWRQLAPQVRLVNSYGPTETTIVATLCDLGGANAVPLGAEVPIGRPLANLEVHVLDPHRQPVAIGIPGELYLGGAGLARGYLNRPELTRERFIPHPWQPQQRLYRTGDRVRYRPDGHLEFLGRLDDQVKLRGYRIELGEIEAVLTQHPLVQEVAVTVYEDQPGHKQLVAYVVLAATATVEGLREFLDERLPDYMVPAAFVVLEQLPLTANGKIDRRSLPAPERSCCGSETPEPQTLIEQTLAQIWADVLGLDQVGVHDNFFHLGGDSILSIQVIAKANQAGLRLTPKQLFQHQTIAELARVVGTTASIQTEQDRVMGAVPLTPIQRWFFEQPWQAPHHWNQSVLLQVRQPLNLAWLEQAVQQLLEHHDLLRSRFWQTEQGWQQAIAEVEPRVSVATFDWTALPTDQQIAALSGRATEIQAGLNLTQGPLLRVALFNVSLDGQPTQRLLIVIHHLVVDGVSWRILLEDLQTAYQQLSQGQTVQLPAKTTSFQQWARQLQAYAQTEQVQQQAAYWQQQLSPVKPLPLDHASGANTAATTQTLSVSLSAEETQILLQELPQCYHTQINDVLLTALVHSFANWTGEPTLLVDLEGHGREPLFPDVDVSRTVGWFTSVFPVRLEATQTVQSTLKQVKAYLRQIPQNGVGYGLLRYLSGHSPNSQQLDWQGLPQPEVSFNYFGQLDTTTSSTSLFVLANEPNGAAHSQVDLRTYLLEINSSVVGGQLKLDWSYSSARHQQETIARLAAGFLAALRTLMAARTAATPCYTPSDFPLAGLDQATLEQAIAQSQAAQRQAQSIESIYPLSPIQQGLLFHLLYNPNSEAYFTQTWGTLVGALNLEAFRQAWQQAVNRHPILRTAFVWDQLDAPLQVVYRHVTLPFEQQDWRHCSAEEQQEQWQSLLQRDRQRGWDPAQAPLMRVTLIQLAEDRYQFIWSTHHLLLDGWSTPLLLQDVLLSYEAFCQNQTPRLPSSPGYGQYITWLQEQPLAEAETFWRQTLQGFRQPTPLPGEATATSAQPQAEAYAEFEVKLSADSTAALQGFSRQFQITLSTLMQGAWALLLSHAAQRQDIVFGATVSGRPTDLPGAEAMVGLFINTLPVRVQLQPDLPLLDWLQALQAQQVEARQYEYTPLAQIQRWSEVPQGLPLFSSVLVFENYPAGAELQPDLQGVQIQAVQSAIRNHYPLTLRVAPQDELSLLWMYDRHQLPTATVQHCAQQLVDLLQVIADRPQVPIQDLLQVLQRSDQQAQTAKAQSLNQASRTTFQRSRRKAIHQ